MFGSIVRLGPPAFIVLYYRVAYIKHSLGLLSEAVEGYTAVLDIEQSYVPALKGERRL